MIRNKTIFGVIYMNMQFNRKLPIPKELKAQYPLSEEMVRVREQNAKEIRAIFD